MSVINSSKVQDLSHLLNEDRMNTQDKLLEVIDIFKKFIVVPQRQDQLQIRRQSLHNQIQINEFLNKMPLILLRLFP